jgi:hypothetical protein
MGSENSCSSSSWNDRAAQSMRMRCMSEPIVPSPSGGTWYEKLSSSHSSTFPLRWAIVDGSTYTW